MAWLSARDTTTLHNVVTEDAYILVPNVKSAEKNTMLVRAGCLLQIEFVNISSIAKQPAAVVARLSNRDTTTLRNIVSSIVIDAADILPDARPAAKSSRIPISLLQINFISIWKIPGIFKTFADVEKYSMIVEEAYYFKQAMTLSARAR